jgi:hypothetical protein
MAILQGATWTDYTSCHNSKWRHYAKRLLEGHRLGAKRHRHHKKRSSAPAPAPATSSPDPTTTSSGYPQPEPYPAPPQYTITWTGW